jgi:uncharacterized protein (TIGR02246 family)
VRNFDGGQGGEVGASLGRAVATGPMPAIIKRPASRRGATHRYLFCGDALNDGSIYMNEEQEKRKIRDVIDTWIQASAQSDLERVLQLMAEDVVFLLPGRPPMRGREAYAAAARPGLGKMRLEGRPDIQEIQICGNYAYCWNYLSVLITPLPDGVTKHHAGNILSIFRKEPDGRWLLFRDANLLTPV